MGMFGSLGSLLGAPRKKKNPWDDDPIVGQQEAAWGFPAKSEPDAMKPQSDRWMDGGKFTGKDALGMALAGIGDAFAREGGGSGDTLSAYMGQATKARDAARKAQAAAAERQAKVGLAQRVNGWDEDKANAYLEGVWKPTEPRQNDTEDDYNFLARTQGKDVADSYARNLGDPVVTVPLSNGSVYSGPRSGLAAAVGGGSAVAGGPKEGDTATNPTTGDKVQFRGGQWVPMGGAARAGVPPFAGNTLDHITMMSESGGNPNAVSPKGARGLMQVMPETARDPGFGIRPSNGTQADDVRVGREYRAAMQRRYQGDPAKMWAAYNAGPGRVDQALKSGEDWLSTLPAETRKYVKRNLRQLGM